MTQYERTQKPEHLLFTKFKSGLGITAPLGLIPELIRQDFHMDLLSPEAGHLTLIVIGVAGRHGGDWPARASLSNSVGCNRRFE